MNRIAIRVLIAAVAAVNWSAEAQVLRQPITSVMPVDGGVSEMRFIEEKIRQGDRLYLLARDMGGVWSINKLLSNGDPLYIKNVLASYGVGYVDVSDSAKAAEAFSVGALATVAEGDLHRTASFDRISPQGVSVVPFGLWDCVKYFSYNLRNTVYKVDKNQDIAIDGGGRPGYARWIGEPGFQLNIAGRSACQDDVRSWGEMTDDGGHLIPRALGGIPWRLNLTPQNASLNRGVWNHYIEGVARYCRLRAKTIYQVRPAYNTEFSVRPNAYFVDMVFERRRSDGIVVVLPEGPNGGAPEATRLPNRALLDAEKAGAEATAAFLKAACTVNID